MPGTGDGASPLVLVVDDDSIQAEMLARMLHLEGFAVAVAGSGEAALGILASEPVAAVVSDLSMPGISGLDLFRQAVAGRPDLPFIITTAFGTLSIAVEAMRAGVHDFLTKPVDVGELVIKLRKALRFQSLEKEVTTLRGTIEALRDRVRIVGNSDAIRRVLDRVAQVAKSTATVMIYGESGTGKELVARAIHLESDRSGGPYIRINCSAIPEALLEAELFGHRKGAFTGAVQDRKGRFLAAHRGTLLLDEIGDLPLTLQPKLLRAIQEREVEPVGATEPVKTDVRILASTHRDLAAMVREGRFREDLFYRLSVIPLVLPPLRQRREDVLPLAEHFLARYCDENHRAMRGFTEGARAALESHPWLGNVRELQNCIERAVVLARGEWIDRADLGIHPAQEPEDSDLVRLLDGYFQAGLSLPGLEQKIILEALDRSRGNVSEAARSLGLTRRTLQYRISKIREEETRDGKPQEPSR